MIVIEVQKQITIDLTINLGPSTPPNGYVTEDLSEFYVAEDGATYYVQE